MVKGMKQKKIAIDQLNYVADIRDYYYQVKAHTHSLTHRLSGQAFTITSHN